MNLFQATVLGSLLLPLPMSGGEADETNLNFLTSEEKSVIIDKSTEAPGSGLYDSYYKPGIYRCKQCNLPLFNSDSKFKSGSGWPSFDDAIEGAIETERDFTRTEIHCQKCKGHLGHLFKGEGFTPKNKRYCVNSLSLDFIPEKGLSKAYFAGGCFWGVEYYLEKLRGVSRVTSGFMGGDVENPSYKEVTKGRTGHVETVEVLYNPSIISYRELAKRFFEIHDPTQVNGQGPDIGPQYLSRVFVFTKEERETVETLITLLKIKYPTVATEIVPEGVFYPAEKYHQDYYERKGGTPYCHAPVKRFD